MGTLSSCFLYCENILGSTLHNLLHLHLYKNIILKSYIDVVAMEHGVEADPEVAGDHSLSGACRIRM